MGVGPAGVVVGTSVAGTIELVAGTYEPPEADPSPSLRDYTAANLYFQVSVGVIGIIYPT